MLTVVTDGNVEVIKRVRPPLELTDIQAAEFQRVVSTMPAEWFCNGNMALLCQYCRHVIMARHLGEMIEQAMSELGHDPLAGKRLHELEKMQLRESAMIGKLMTQLRLTPRAVAPRNVSMKSMHEVESPWSGLKQISDQS
jgi:hypothetical protein